MSSPPLIATSVDPRIGALDQIRKRVSADVAMIHALRVRDDGLPARFTDVVTVGPLHIVEAMRHMEGMSASTLDTDLSQAFGLNAFTFVRRAQLPPAVTEAIWRPLGIHDGMGAFIEHPSDGTIVGAVTVLRTEHPQPFEDAERRRANSQIKRLRAAATARDARFAHLTQQPGTIICKPSGAVAFGTPTLIDDADLLKAASDFAKAIASPHAALCRQLGALTMTAGPLRGDDGPAVAIEVHPTTRMRVPPALRLTAVKRQVVAFAIEGATVPEIAKEMNRSPETIRAHLKQVYETLRVSSRVDLAQACRTMWR